MSWFLTQLPRWLVLILPVLMANCGISYAQTFPEIHQPAVQVRSPQKVMLISVARAGNRIVAVGIHGLIIYSDNNGQSWTQASVPVSGSITSIAFADPKNGWAAGAFGVVLHTTDAGKTWTKQLDGIAVNKLMVTAAQQYAAANQDQPMAAMAVRRAGILSGAGPDKAFLTVQTLSDREALVFGGYRTCVFTNDAGANWTDCSLKISDPLSHNLYDVFTAGSQIYLVGEAGSIFRSDDGGKTFVALTPPSEATIFGILVTAKNTLLAYGVAGSLFRSTDSGKTWTVVALPSQSNLLSGEILASGKVIIVNAAGVAFSTVDDGQTFTPVPLNARMGVYGVQQAANGDVVLVGSGGVRVVPASELNGID